MLINSWLLMENSLMMIRLMDTCHLYVSREKPSYLPVLCIGISLYEI